MECFRAELQCAEIDVLGHESQLPQIVNQRRVVGVHGRQIRLGQPRKDSLILRVVAMEEETGKHATS